jgi:hypothetical protein
MKQLAERFAKRKDSPAKRTTTKKTTGKGD